MEGDAGQPLLQRDVVAAEGVEKVGVAFSGRPPERLFVTQVQPGAWAAECGIGPGDEIVALNGRRVEGMGAADFGAAMGKRPLVVTLATRRAVLGGVPPGHEALSFEAGDGVASVGMAFTALPPERMFVKTFQPGSWAESSGIRVGDELALLNRRRPADLTLESMKAEMQRRPIAFVVLRALGAPAQAARATVGAATGSPTGAPTPAAAPPGAAPRAASAAKAPIPRPPTAAGPGSPTAMASPAASPATVRSASPGGVRSIPRARFAEEAAASPPDSPRTQAAEDLPITWPGPRPRARLAEGLRAGHGAAGPRGWVDEELAALRLQAAIRGLLARRSLARFRQAFGAVTLEGFVRGALNGRYVRSERWVDRVNGRETYDHEAGVLVLYYCGAHDDWRVTNTRANAARNLGWARGPRGVGLTRACFARTWHEWDRESSTWHRFTAGVTALEVQGHVRFELSGWALEADRTWRQSAAPALRPGAELAMQRAIAAAAGPPVRPPGVELRLAPLPGAGVEVRARVLAQGAPLPWAGRRAICAEALAAELRRELSRRLGQRAPDDAVDRVVAGCVPETVVRWAVGDVVPQSDVLPLQASATLNSTGLTRSSGRRSASAARSPGPSPRAATPRRRGALEELKAALLHYGPSFANVWRRLLDPRCRGFITFGELCCVAAQLKYHGSLREAFDEMDAGGIGKVTLQEFDYPTAQALKVFAESARARFGSLEAATQYIGVDGGRRLNREEFKSSLIVNKLGTAEEADEVFHLLSNSTSPQTLARFPASDRHARVTRAEFRWLDAIDRWLPSAPSQRVTPGAAPASKDDAVGDAAMDDGQASTVTPGSQADDVAPLEEASVDGGGHGPFLLDTVYSRLWTAATSTMQRREALEADIRKPPWRCPGDPVNQRALDRLHDEVFWRQAAAKERAEREELFARFALTEGRPPPKRDPRIVKRLLQPRPSFREQREKALREAMTADVGPKDPNASTETPDPEAGERATERMYKEAEMRRQRHEERVEKYKRRWAEEEAAEMPPKRPQAPMSDEDFLDRFYNRHVPQWQSKRQERAERRRRLEDEEMRECQEGRVDRQTAYNPDAWCRLYVDSHRQQERAEALRRAAFEEEHRRLEADRRRPRRAPSPRGRHWSQGPDAAGDGGAAPRDLGAAPGWQPRAEAHGASGLVLGSGAQRAVASEPMWWAGRPLVPPPDGDEAWPAGGEPPPSMRSALSERPMAAVSSGASSRRPSPRSRPMSQGRSGASLDGPAAHRHEEPPWPSASPRRSGGAAATMGPSSSWAGAGGDEFYEAWPDGGDEPAPPQMRRALSERPFAAVAAAASPSRRALVARPTFLRRSGDLAARAPGVGLDPRDPPCGCPQRRGAEAPPQRRGEASPWRSASPRRPSGASSARGSGPAAGWGGEESHEVRNAMSERNWNRPRPSYSRVGATLSIPIP